MDKTDFNQKAFDKRMSALDKLSFNSLIKPSDKFQELMVEEFDLAVNMDKVSWERLRIAKAIRSNKSVTSKELHLHREHLSTMASNFKKIWRKVNKESRLCDNMFIFNEAIKEIK